MKMQLFHSYEYTVLRTLTFFGIDYNVGIEDNNQLVWSIIVIFDNTLFRAFSPEAITHL